MIPQYATIMILPIQLSGHMVSGGIKGGGGMGAFTSPPPVGGSAPHLPPSQKKKMAKMPFLANFWIFAPSESHFAPSMQPTKKKKKYSGTATAQGQVGLHYIVHVINSLKPKAGL